MRLFSARGEIMSQTADPRVRWTMTDLELLPDISNRYEIIDGELLVTKALHWGHQKSTTNTTAELCEQFFE